MRHGGGPDLALLETLGEQAGARHEAESGGAAGGGSACLVQGADHVEIEAAGIDLADGAERSLEAEVFDDPALEAVDLLGIAAKEGELVELRADGALEAADRVAGREIVEPAGGEQQFLPEHGEALAQGGGLGRHVVRAAGQHEVAVLGGAGGEQVEGGCGLEADELQRTGNLELLDILGEVTAGEPEVDELPLGQLGEFFDACLHVVERGALALLDPGDVDLGADALVVLDRLGRDGDAEVALGLHHGNPEIALEQDAAVGRPDLAHGGRSVALGQHVGNRFGGSGGGRRHGGRARVKRPAPACQWKTALGAGHGGPDRNQRKEQMYSQRPPATVTVNPDLPGTSKYWPAA